MRTVFGLVLLAVGLLAGPVGADDVYLTNGESFEGVIAEREGDDLRVRLAFGELLLPMSSIERIEQARSPLDEFLERQATLASGGGSAAEWLELARWARARELRHSQREALLEAANMDPHLDGLRPGMRELGYVLDADLDRWISYDDHMRNRGMVRSNGEWVRPEALRAAAEERSEPREQRSAVEETLSRAVELLAMAEVARETSRPATQTTPYYPPAYGYPVAYVTGWHLPPSKRHAAGRDRVESHPVTHSIVRQPSNAIARELLSRQPGSVVPMRIPDRGGVARPVPGARR
jgi:hypothetical protein